MHGFLKTNSQFIYSNVSVLKKALAYDYGWVSFFYLFLFGAKSILLKQYWCLNGAWTDTYKKNYQLIIGVAISTKHM